MSPLDRPGAHDRHLDHQVVEASGAQARQHRHLRPALDLEHADRVGPRDHPVAEQEAARVDRQVPREVLDLVDELGEVLVRPGRRVEARRRAAGRAVIGLPPQCERAWPAGRVRSPGSRAPCRPRAPPSAGGSGSRWRPSPRARPYLLVDVLDHLLAPVVLDVEVDVGRLGGARDRKRSNSRSIRTGSTAVMPRQ
jgi:hypothetical protein